MAAGWKWLLAVKMGVSCMCVFWTQQTLTVPQRYFVSIQRSFSVIILVDSGQ